jgi:hypothetical protein
MADPRSLPDVDHLTMDVVLLDEGDLDGRFRGNAALAAVADRATRSDPTERYPSVAAFVTAWRVAARPHSLYRQE